MIKVVHGGKGVGKTRYLVDDAHSFLNDCKGEIVFIDTGNKLITGLKHQIRLVNVRDFPVDNLYSFYGFISGMIAANFDIVAVYVDRLDAVLEKDPDYKTFFDKVKLLSEQFNIRFMFSVSGNIKDIPDYVTSIKISPAVNL
ncbi:MAG TPA: hypothetical protein DCE11_00530 [Ruminiclostridium sp.]|jgi:hypothetical protein|nr:hypothetical protein [Clostridiaceae bacterium]HAA24593.1 hypothetical protein [Ruminiclostridium sp.]